MPGLEALKGAINGLDCLLIGFRLLGPAQSVPGRTAVVLATVHAIARERRAIVSHVKEPNQSQDRPHILSDHQHIRRLRARPSMASSVRGSGSQIRHRKLQCALAFCGKLRNQGQLRAHAGREDVWSFAGYSADIPVLHHLAGGCEVSSSPLRRKDSGGRIIRGGESGGNPSYMHEPLPTDDVHCISKCLAHDLQVGFHAARRAYRTCSNRARAALP